MFIKILKCLHNKHNLKYVTQYLHRTFFLNTQINVTFSKKQTFYKCSIKTFYQSLSNLSLRHSERT